MRGLRPRTSSSRRPGTSASSRRPSLRAVLSVLGTLALMASGCTQPATVIHERTLTLAPGGFAEVNLVMTEGQTVRWDWGAGGVVHFDVHNHAGSEVTEHRVEDADGGRGSFEAPSSGGFSLMWENTGRYPVQLTYKVTGEAKLDPDHPPYPR